MNAAAILAPVPEWVTKGWYEGDPVGFRIAEDRFRRPHSTAEERASSHAAVVARAALIRQGDALYELGFPCSSCQQFRFDKPTVCFWCRNDSPDCVSKNATVNKNPGFDHDSP